MSTSGERQRTVRDATRVIQAEPSLYKFSRSSSDPFDQSKPIHGERSRLGGNVVGPGSRSFPPSPLPCTHLGGKSITPTTVSQRLHSGEFVSRRSLPLSPLSPTHLGGKSITPTSLPQKLHWGESVSRRSLPSSPLSPAHLRGTLMDASRLKHAEIAPSKFSRSITTSFELSTVKELVNSETFRSGGHVGEWSKSSPTSPSPCIHLRGKSVNPTSILERLKSGEFASRRTFPSCPPTSSSCPHLPDKPVNTFIPQGSTSSPPSPLFCPKVPIKALYTYISLLRTNSTMQVLKSLKELTSIASYPKGQIEFFQAGGIPAVTRLVTEKDELVAEKALGVLEALTWGEAGVPVLHSETRHQIYRAVTDTALDTLIALMQEGNRNTRLKASKIVINILEDDKIKVEISLLSEIVRAFCSLTNIAEGLGVPNGEAVCIEGLNMLSGQKPSGSATDLATSLLNLAAFGSSPEVVGEALLCFRSVVEGESMCFTKSLDGLPLEIVVTLLGREHTFEYRKAAAIIICEFAFTNINSMVLADKEVIDSLLNIVGQHDLPINLRENAAEGLLLIARKDNLSCLGVVEADRSTTLLVFALNFGTESMAVEVLYMFSKTGNYKQTVLELGGAKYLLDALQDGSMKEKSASALVNLVDSIPGKKLLLEAGIIGSVTGCILLDEGTLCTIELTRILISILDSKSNAERIRESAGVQALVFVMEKSNEVGKNLAATALTKLIRLDPESSSILGQLDGITLLLKLVKLRQVTLDVQALEALSVASGDSKNKMLIVQNKAIPVLLSIATGEVPVAQELALEVLLNLSRTCPLSEEHDISATLVNAKMSKHLLKIIQTESQPSFSEKAIQRAICIVRNLSLTGSRARAAMLEEGKGIVTVLLDRIRFHEVNGYIDIVQVSVIALEKFMLDSRGTMALIREGGINIIQQVLLYTSGTPGTARVFALKILVMLIQDPTATKEVCKMILQANVVPCLKDTLEYGPTSECRRQASFLLKLLIYSGPREAVCRTIREEGCIAKLLDVRADLSCLPVATDALVLLKTYDKECRRQIF